MFDRKDMENMLDEYSKSMNPVELLEKLAPEEKRRIGQALIDQANEATATPAPEAPVHAIPADRQKSIRDKMQRYFNQK